MDGDFSPLTEIAIICKEHNANLIVDEAHASGVFGKKGDGESYQFSEYSYATH